MHNHIGFWFWCEDYTEKCKICLYSIFISSPKLLLFLLPRWNHSLGVGGLLRENPEDEVSLFVRLEGGGDDDVFAGRQTQARADLPQVDEELWASAGGVGEEEVSLQVDPWPAHSLSVETEICVLFIFSQLKLLIGLHPIMFTFHNIWIAEQGIHIPHLEPGQGERWDNYHDGHDQRHKKRWKNPKTSLDSYITVT